MAVKKSRRIIPVCRRKRINTFAITAIAMTLTIRLARNFKSFDRFTRFRIVRTMSSQSFLVDHPRYAFLKDLGLQSHNQGVYNGKWFANGMVSFEMLICDVVADVFVL